MDEIDIFLDKEIRYIQEYVKGIIAEQDHFNSKLNVIRLFYRGEMMDSSKQLGYYVKSNDSIQIFKLARPSIH